MYPHTDVSFKRTTTLLVVLLVAILAGFASTSFAQEAGAEGLALEEVIVTAQ